MEISGKSCGIVLNILFKTAVNKIKIVHKYGFEIVELFKNRAFAQILQNKIHGVLHNDFSNFNLLIMSFPRFAQRTINTTALYNYEKR